MAVGKGEWGEADNQSHGVTLMFEENARSTTTVKIRDRKNEKPQIGFPKKVGGAKT